MKKALSNLLIGITATNLAQPLSAGHDELIPTSTLPAKQREFKYTFEVMKMICAMRVVVNPEDPGDPLVDAVSDQLLKVAPSLISGIHSPSDATYLLDVVFRTDSAGDYEILKQALYKAAGLELPEKAPSLVIEESRVEKVVTNTPKPLHTTEAVETAKKREFEYVIESMKMQHRRRIAVPLEDSLVDAVSDQLRKGEPSLISNIHSPDDVTGLLGREIKADSAGDYDILKQALYKAAGLDLPTEASVLEVEENTLEEAVVDTTNPTHTTERAEAAIHTSEVCMTGEEVVTSDPSASDAATTLTGIEDPTIIEELVVDSAVSLESTPTVEAVVDLSDARMTSEEVIPLQLQTESVSDIEIKALQEAQTIGDQVTENHSIAIDMLRMENQHAQTHSPRKSQAPSQAIEFLIDLNLGQTPTYSPSFIASKSSEYIRKSPKTAQIGFETKKNDLMKKIEIFPSIKAKLLVKSKVKLKPKVETQLKPAATSSILNHLGIAYLAGLMMILMSFVKDALGLRTRIQIAARPINHYYGKNISILLANPFNMNHRNNNSKFYYKHKKAKPIKILKI